MDNTVSDERALALQTIEHLRQSPLLKNHLAGLDAASALLALKAEQPAAQAFDFRKELNKNDPDVEVCQEIQHGRERVRRLAPEDLDADLDMSDSHTALFALAEYWQGKYKKLKEQPAAQGEPASRTARAMELTKQVHAGCDASCVVCRGAHAHPALAAQGEPVAWRDLKSGEVVQAGDRLLNNGKEWVTLQADSHAVGKTYESEIFWPTQRRYTHPSPAAQVPQEWIDTISHAVSELEVLDDATAQIQSDALRDLLSASPKPPEPKQADALWESHRAAQVSAVMPLIGPLLDAWENADREVMRQEPELSRQLAAINRAMEDAESSPKPPAQAVEQAVAAERDPCPGCNPGHVCRTPKCGRLKLPADHPLRNSQAAPGVQAEKGGAL